jgi:hypothetical protein
LIITANYIGDKMPIKIVDPFELRTEGGYIARITGIDKDDSDCLIGEVTTPGAGTIHVRWNICGTARDCNNKCNLNPSSVEFKKLKRRINI